MSITLSQLGEFGLIDLLKKYHGSRINVIKGIGDDTAVVPLDAKRYLLLTTDMIMEGVHFKRNAPPRLIGRKALACSMSDIAAMGGIPKYALVSLGVPGDLSMRFVCAIYEGMHRLARQFHVAVVGGDTVRSSKIIINVSLIGEVKKQEVVYRQGAQEKDQVFVTGRLGRSLQSGWHFKFVPRLRESRYLVTHFKPSAMIDISDGLAADLGHILKESGAGAVLWEERIPRRKGAGLKNALSDGEDFELLFTLAPGRAAALSKCGAPFRFYPVGEIVAEGRGLLLLDPKGTYRKISAQGYTHF